MRSGAELRSVRLDLARGDATGSWSIAREGLPLPLSIDLEPGGERVLQPLELFLPAVTPEELQGGWLVVVLELETEDGGVGWTYAHMDRDLSLGIARRALAHRRGSGAAP